MRRRKIKFAMTRKLTATLLALCSFVAVWAQSDIWRTDSLQEIVVTGTGTQHFLKDAPVQTEVITGKMLRQYAGKSIEDILSALATVAGCHWKKTESGYALY